MCPGPARARRDTPTGSVRAAPGNWGWGKGCVPRVVCPSAFAQCKSRPLLNGSLILIYGGGGWFLVVSECLCFVSGRKAPMVPLTRILLYWRVLASTPHVSVRRWIRSQKKVCVPKIDLQIRAPLIDFFFFSRRKNLLM